MPEKLRQALQKTAEQNHRSLNAEILARLEESFDDYLVAGHRLSAEISPEEAADWKERVLAVEEAVRAFVGSRSLSEPIDSESESKPDK
nr:Arc family DNA-binding protein [Halomonas olivaria]